MSTTQTTVWQRGDVRVVSQGQSFYIEEWIENEREWIEHVDILALDQPGAIEAATDLWKELEQSK